MASPPRRVAQTGMAAELNFVADDYTGPVSYTTNGVTVGASALGFPGGVYAVIPMDASVSGTYRLVITSVSGVRRSTVVIRWFVIATGLEVGNGTNLSAEKFRFVAWGV